MIKDYYGTKRITAWPQSKNGKPGYAVKYPDGYVSWSPKGVFEAAYQPITAMSFGHAVEALKAGERVTRAGWNGAGLWLELQTLDEHGKLPYLYLNYPADAAKTPGDGGEWVATQDDVLAEDWLILDEQG